MASNIKSTKKAGVQTAAVAPESLSAAGNEADEAAREGDPQGALASPGAETPDRPNKKSSGDDTAETQGNQGQSAVPQGHDGAVNAAKTGTLDAGQLASIANLFQRSANAAAILMDKEGLQVAYVRYKWPKPYYVRWKGEANDLFVLSVTLKRRRMRIEAKSRAG